MCISIIGFEGDIKLTGNIDYEKKIDNLKSIDQIDDYLLYKERKGLILGKENRTRMISLKSLDINKLRAFYEINLNEVIDSDLADVKEDTSKSEINKQDRKDLTNKIQFVND